MFMLLIIFYFLQSIIENQSEENEASLNIFATKATIDENDLVCFEDLLPLDPSYSISAIFNVMVIILYYFLMNLCTN